MKSGCSESLGSDKIVGKIDENDNIQITLANNLRQGWN